jgi:uncharacterized membrane-anchored protein YitT (DUF2179 family)
MANKIWDYVGITIGTFITALGMSVFLIPNRIASGGVSGLATVIYYTFGFKVGITMLVINIPLFLLGIKELGMKFIFKTLYATVAFSLFVDLLETFVSPPTRDLLLSSIYGGLVVGLGLGVVFRFGATTGGTDLAAQIIYRYLRISVGQTLLLIDGLVIILAAFVFGIELALYAFLVVFLTSKVIDLIQEGEGFAKAVFIISDYNSQIGKAILQDLNRGITYLEGRGGFSGRSREIILVVVGRSELSTLKNLVRNIDPRAFVMVSNMNEVLGEGFKSMVDGQRR